MQLRNILGALALSATTYAQSLPSRLVYQFENSFSGVGYVNIENVAVRSSNGQLLLNLATGAIMAQLNPDAANPQPELLVNISNAYPGAPGSLAGIAETGKDIFTVAAGNFVYGPSVVGGVAGVPGSFSVWTVDLTGPKAKATKLVDIPEAGTLNGITTLKDSSEYVLIADSALGAIWRVNVKTGSYESAIASPLLGPAPYFQFGVNGIHTQGPYLYFTNSALGFFGAVPINNVGQPVGPVTPFVNATNGTSFDDFALDHEGNAYIATQPDAVYKITRDSPVPILVAGGPDAPVSFLGPTSAVFKGNILYVVTGGQGGPSPQSGQVFAIDTSTTTSKEKMKRWIA